jgi:hypothetical protein
MVVLIALVDIGAIALDGEGLHRLAIVEHQRYLDALVLHDEAGHAHIVRPFEPVGAEVELPVLPVVLNRGLVVIEAREEGIDVVRYGSPPMSTPLKMSRQDARKSSLSIACE